MTETVTDLLVVPERMRAAPRWVRRDSRKRPLDPRTGRWASVRRPADWAPLDVAARSPYGAGLGYVLGRGFACVDLDHAILEDGNLTPGARALLDFYPRAFVEVSPSGRGLHVWGFAAPQRGIRREWRGQSVEFYSRGRYVTVTGCVYRRGELRPL